MPCQAIHKYHPKQASSVIVLVVTVLLAVAMVQALFVCQTTALPSQHGTSVVIGAQSAEKSSSVDTDLPVVRVCLPTRCSDFPADTTEFTRVDRDRLCKKWDRLPALSLSLSLSDCILISSSVPS